MRPGLTGWAQVHGRNFVNWDDRLSYDCYYVRHISFMLDVKIVLMTIKTVLGRSNVASDTAKAEGNLADIRRKGRVDNK